LSSLILSTVFTSSPNLNYFLAVSYATTVSGITFLEVCGLEEGDRI